MAELALKIRGLKKTYGAFTLGPLDLAVPQGAIYGYVGSNGAGKTTTMDLIMGMGRKDGGSIEVFGLDHIEDHDNFFELGGTSLSAAQMLERIENELALGVELSDLVFQTFSQVVASSRRLRSTAQSST